LFKRPVLSVETDGCVDNVHLRSFSDVIDVSVEEAINIISNDHLSYNRMSYKLRSNKKIALHYIKETITRGEEPAADIPFELMSDHEILCSSITFDHESFQKNLENQENFNRIDLNLEDYVNFLISAFDKNDKRKSMVVEVELEKAVMYNYNFFQFSPECKFINDELEQSDVCSTSNTDYLLLEYLIKKWLDINGAVLKFMPDKVKNDRYMVQKAVNQNELAIQFAPTQLIGYFIEDCIERGLTLKDLEKESRSNPKIAIGLVRKNPLDFKLLSEKLRDNYEVAMTAVKGNRTVFMFVSDRLQDNYNLARVACGNIVENIVGYVWKYNENYWCSSLRVQDLLDKELRKRLGSRDKIMQKVVDEFFGDKKIKD
jgi:hypothetical protein